MTPIIRCQSPLQAFSLSRLEKIQNLRPMPQAMKHHLLAIVQSLADPWLSAGMVTRPIACMIVFVFATSCKKEDHAASNGDDETAPRQRTGMEGFSGEDRRRNRSDSDRRQDRTRQLEFSKLLNSARKSFDTHDISSVLTALEEADDLYEAHPDVLNLRGSCHVELRDFEKALTDFSQALKKMPDSPAIHFNIGEVHFVSKRWDDAVRSFNQAKDNLAPESDALVQLIDFKLMLCEAGRGNRVEFEAKADANSQVQGAILSEYTNVVRAFQAEDDAAAGEAFKTISGSFPNAEVRAPWNDTLNEFGYVTPAVR